MNKNNYHNPIRLTIIISSLDGGGAERQCVHFMKYLSSHYAFDIHAIIYKNETDYLRDDKNITIHKIERKPGEFFISIGQIRKILREIKPDIVHSYMPFPSLLASLAVSRRSWFVADFYRSVHAMPFPSREWLAQKIVHRFADVIVSNNYAAIRFHKKEKSSKVICIHNSFDPGRLRSAERPTEAMDDTIRIIFLSRMDGPKKDIPRFTDLARKVLAIRENVTFICAGDGKKRQEYMDQAEDILGRGMEFPGTIRDVESFLPQCDIGFLLNFPMGTYDGISNSIMEYMACGLPVIASDRGGTPELVVDGETGYLVGDNDDDLFEKTIRLIDQTQLRRQMGLNGKTRIETEFTMPKMTKNYLRRAYRLNNLPNRG